MSHELGGLQERSISCNGGFKVLIYRESVLPPSADLFLLISPTSYALRQNQASGRNESVLLIDITDIDDIVYNGLPLNSN